MKNHPLLNRQGLLPPDCKDLIDHQPLGAETSDVFRDSADPEEIGILLERAKGYLKEGHLEKAFILLDRVLGLNPNHYPYVFEIRRVPVKEE